MAKLPATKGGRGTPIKKSRKVIVMPGCETPSTNRKKINVKKDVIGDEGVEADFAPEYRSNAAIVKSNEISRAKYNLPLNAHRIVTLYLSHLSSEVQRFPFIRIPMSQIIEAFPSLSGNKRAGEQVDAAVDELWRSEVVLHKGDDWIKYRWAVTAKKQGGEIYIRLNDDLLPYLANQIARYSSYQVGYVVRLGTAHQFRLYEFLRSYLFLGQQRVLFDNLKDSIGIEPDKYPTSAGFWRRVLRPALDQINKVTDIEVHVRKLIKRRQKIIGWVFEIREKPQKQLDLSLGGSPVIERLINCEFDRHEAEALAQRYDVEYLNKKIDYAEYEYKQNRVANISGFLRKAITADWDVSRRPKVDKSTTSNRKPARSIQDVIHEELERQAQAKLEESRKQYVRKFRVQKALEQYQQTDDARRVEIHKAFTGWLAKRGGAANILYQRHGRDEPMVQREFEGFLVACLKIPEPSDDALEAFQAAQIEPLGPELDAAPFPERRDKDDGDAADPAQKRPHRGLNPFR